MERGADGFPRLCTWCLDLVARPASKGLVDDSFELEVDVLRWGIPLGRDWVDRLDLFLERPLAIIFVLLFFELGLVVLLIFCDITLFFLTIVASLVC